MIVKFRCIWSRLVFLLFLWWYLTSSHISGNNAVDLKIQTQSLWLFFFVVVLSFIKLNWRATMIYGYLLMFALTVLWYFGSREQQKKRLELKQYLNWKRDLFFAIAMLLHCLYLMLKCTNTAHSMTYIISKIDGQFVFLRNFSDLSVCQMNKCNGSTGTHTEPHFISLIHWISVQ